MSVAWREDGTRPRPRWDIVVAVILGCFFVSLNLYDAWRLPLWSDEGWTLSEITGVLTSVGLSIPVGKVMPTERLRVLVEQPGPFEEVAGSLYHHDTHPSVYFQMLWVWAHAWGLDRWALRLLSVLSMALVSVLLFVYGRRVLGAAALLPFVFSLTNPGAVYAAINMRGYGVAILFSTVALVAFMTALRGHRPVLWAGLAGWAAGMAAITHYFSLLMLLPAGLTALLLLASQRRWKAVGASVLGALPGLYVLASWLPQQVGARPEQMRGFEPLAVQFFALFRVFVNQFTRYTLDNPMIALTTTVAAAALLAAILVVGRRGWSTPDVAVPFAGTMGFLLGLCALFWATDKTLLVFSVPRYAVLSLPALALMLGHLVPERRRGSPWVVVPLVGGLLLAGGWPRMDPARFDHPWAIEQVVADGEEDILRAGPDALILLTGVDAGRLGTALHDLPSGMKAVYLPTSEGFEEVLEASGYPVVVVRPLSAEARHDSLEKWRGYSVVAREAGYTTEGRVWRRP